MGTADADAFYPIEIEFTSNKTFCDIAVESVTHTQVRWHLGQGPACMLGGCLRCLAYAHLQHVYGGGLWGLGSGWLGDAVHALISVSCWVGACGAGAVYVMCSTSGTLVS